MGDGQSENQPLLRDGKWLRSCDTTCFDNWWFNLNLFLFFVAKQSSLYYSIACLGTCYCVTENADSSVVTFTIVTHSVHAGFDWFPEEENVSTISPIGPDELPPPYQQAGMPMVTCRVCQAMIDISGKREQHVVKCSECNEATVSYLLSTYR